MSKRRSDDERGASDVAGPGDGVNPPPASDGAASEKAKPVHEERIGRVKAVIWANRTQNGLRHNVTLKRIFKRDESSAWEQSDSFGRDDLPLVMEVTRRAWLWVYDQGQSA